MKASSCKEEVIMTDEEHCEIRKRISSESYPEVALYIKGMIGKYGRYFNVELCIRDHVLVKYNGKTMHMVKTKGTRFLEENWVAIGSAMMRADEGDDKSIPRLLSEYKRYDLNELVQDIFDAVKKKGFKKKEPKQRVKYENSNGGRNDWK